MLPLLRQLVCSFTRAGVAKTHVSRAPPHQPAAIESNKAVACCAPNDGSVDFVLYDSTLRPGDAVMTKDGIRVFEGRISSRHVPA